MLVLLSLVELVVGVLYPVLLTRQTLARSPPRRSLKATTHWCCYWIAFSALQLVKNAGLPLLWVRTGLVVLLAVPSFKACEPLVDFLSEYRLFAN